MKNRLAKLSLIILFSLAFSVVASAQTCDLSSKTAALFLNLPIGASPEQTQSIIGKALKIKVKKKGERTFFQNYIKKPAPESLRGVRALYLRFFDGRLYQIEIFYEPRTDLNSLEILTSRLATELNFPVENWEIENGQAKIQCGETSLVADYVLNPRVELTDEIIRAKIVEARKDEEKK